MGYTTEFKGTFKLDRKASEEVTRLLKGLNETRRMKRNVDEDKYGIEGEFYFNHDDFFGQTHEDNIIDYNEPPRTQPGLWCEWRLNEDGVTIEWDGAEKFYSYAEWLTYIINKVLKPHDYVLNGKTYWQGEDPDDIGTIEVINNEVLVNYGQDIKNTNSKEMK